MNLKNFITLNLTRNIYLKKNIIYPSNKLVIFRNLFSFSIFICVCVDISLAPNLQIFLFFFGKNLDFPVNIFYKKIIVSKIYKFFYKSAPTES